MPGAPVHLIAVETSPCCSTGGTSMRDNRLTARCCCMAECMMSHEWDAASLVHCSGKRQKLFVAVFSVLKKLNAS